MNTYDYLMTCLGEECNEVAQRVSKLLRFGAGEIEPGQTLTNLMRLRRELHDLHGVIAMLDDMGMILYEPTPETDAAKRAKIQKYLAYARDIGAVSDNMDDGRRE